MPVLEAEPTLYPYDLFDTPAVEEEPWFVVRTRNRAEKSLARLLHRDRVPYFLPLQTKRRRVQRRLVESHLPLFPGYVFIRTSDDDFDMDKMRRTNLVASLLPVFDGARLRADLDALHRIIDAGEALTPEEQLLAGEAVQIVSGPLAGHRGRVLRDGDRTRVVITVDFIQQGASIEIDPSFLSVDTDITRPSRPSRRATRSSAL